MGPIIIFTYKNNEKIRSISTTLQTILHLPSYEWGHPGGWKKVMSVLYDAGPDWVQWNYASLLHWGWWRKKQWWPLVTGLCRAYLYTFSTHPILFQWPSMSNGIIWRKELVMYRPQMFELSRFQIWYCCNEIQNLCQKGHASFQTLSFWSPCVLLKSPTSQTCWFSFSMLIKRMNSHDGWKSTLGSLVPGWQ